MGTVCSAIKEMLRLHQFELSTSDLTWLENRNDWLISGWVFAYRYYESEPSRQLIILREGLSNSNPRIREQVCDIIGDNHISEMRSALQVLFDDLAP